MVEFGHFPAILFEVTLGLWVYVPAPMIWCLWFVAWCPLPSVMSLALSLTAWLCALHVLLPVFHPLSPPVCRVFPFFLSPWWACCFGSPSSHVCVQFGFLCLVIPNLSLLCSHVPPLSLITLTVSVPLCPSPGRQFTSLHVSGSMFCVPSVYFCPV